jgi:hypothetical protein
MSLQEQNRIVLDFKLMYDNYFRTNYCYVTTYKNFIFCSVILCVNIPVGKTMSYKQTKKDRSIVSSMFTHSSRIKQRKTGLTVNRQQVGCSS